MGGKAPTRTIAERCAPAPGASAVATPRCAGAARAHARALQSGGMGMHASALAPAQPLEAKAPWV